MSGRWWHRGASVPVEPCNATELMLRSGRVAAPTEPAERTADELFETGLGELSHRLGIALVILGPHRVSEDDGLRRVYRAVHDAMTDLAGLLALVSVGKRPAPPARPARRRRPWGARS